MFATARGWHVRSRSRDPVVLMLTIDAPTQEALWRAWVPAHTRILVNSKRWRPQLGDPTFKLIEHNVVETAWGTASLVQAHEALLKEGISIFPNASHYVLVSGDSAPVKTYRHFVDEMHRYAGVTLITAMFEKFNYAVLDLVTEARERGVNVGWWENIYRKGLDVPVAWQWSAVSNDAARYLAREGMTEKAVLYEAMCRSLGYWGNMLSADEVVPHAILMEHGDAFAIDSRNMGPVWCSIDETGKHADAHTYSAVLLETNQRSNYIFARKIKPFDYRNRIDVVLIKERLGLDVPLPAAPVAQTVAFRRKARTSVDFTQRIE